MSADTLTWHHRAVVLAGCAEFGDDVPPVAMPGNKTAGALKDDSAMEADSGEGGGIDSANNPVDMAAPALDTTRQGSELAPTLQRFRQYLRRSSVEVKVHDRWGGDGILSAGVDFGAQEALVAQAGCGNGLSSYLLVPRDAREAMERCLSECLVGEAGVPSVGAFSALGRLRGETWMGQRARWEAAARFFVAFALSSEDGDSGSGAAGGSSSTKGKSKAAKAKPAKGTKPGKGGKDERAGGAAGAEPGGPRDLVRLGCAAPRMLPVVAGRPQEPLLTPADLALQPPPRAGVGGEGATYSFDWDPEDERQCTPSALVLTVLAFADRAVTRESVEDREAADQQNPHAVVKAKLHSLLDASAARLAAI